MSDMDNGVYLGVDLLWDALLLDPGVHLGQLLALRGGEPGLQGLHQQQLVAVLLQHLRLVPAHRGAHVGESSQERDRTNTTQERPAQQDRSSAVSYPPTRGEPLDLQ